MNLDKSGTNIFLKIFSKFLGVKKEGGWGSFWEKGGIRKRQFSTLTSTAFDG
jgi:hypothetical protein